MNEFQLHYIWHFRLFKSFTLYSVKHEKIEIISGGKPNKENGPDFQNALIKINGILWSGNIELHVKSSDWLKHGHNADKNYHNVILHVVWENDKNIETNEGLEICTLELKNIQSIATSSQILSLKEKINGLTCERFLKNVPRKMFFEWINLCAEKRMREKIKNMQKTIPDLKLNQNQGFYILLGKYMVGKANQNQLQELLEILPWKIIHQKRENIVTVLTILIFYSGLINKIPLEIQKTLSTEYDYLKKLYKVTPPECINWKTGGIFPKGQIENRILQLGFLLCYFLEQSIFNPDHLYFEKWNEKLKIKLSAILATDTTATLIKFKQDLIPGKEKLKSIYVNLLFPLMEKENPSVFSNFENLNALMSEKNHITLKFEKLGLKAKNLLESQGQTELYENYCRRHLCLRCEIGKKILTINSAA